MILLMIHLKMINQIIFSFSEIPVKIERLLKSQGKEDNLKQAIISKVVFNCEKITFILKNNILNLNNEILKILVQLII